MFDKFDLFFHDLINYLFQPVDTTVISLYATVSITASVLFITISIIPFQQYATTHSLSVLKYLQKCKKIIVPYILIILFSILLLILPLIANSRFHLYVGLLTAIFVLIMIGYSWKVIINLLNPEYFLLPTIKSDIEKTIDKCILNAERTPKTDFEKINELRDMIDQSMLNAIKIDPEEKYYKIYRNQIRPAYNKTLLLKELLSIYARKDQRDLFTITLQYYNDIIIHYINKRKNYKDNHDDFLIDIADDLADIVKVVDLQKNIHFQRVIWKLIENICISSCFMNAVQSSNGNNSLCRAYTEMLNESFYKDLLRSNYDSAFEIARSLGEIGCHYALTSIYNSAATIVEQLKAFSELSFSKSRTEITFISRYYIAKIFYNLIFSYNSQKYYGHAFDKIIKVYKEIILNSDSIPSIASTDYIFWYEPDVSKDLSLAGIFRILLFPLNYSGDVEYDDIQIRNKEIRDKLLNLIKTALSKKTNQVNAFPDILCQIALYHIGFIHHQVCNDILITYNFTTIPNQSQKDQVTNELDSIVDFYFDLILNHWKDESDNLDADTLEHSFISILLLDIYWSNKHDNIRLGYLNQKIDKYLFRIKSDLNSLSIRRETLRALIESALYLKRINLSTTLGRKIFFVARSAYNKDIGYDFSLHQKTFIKRPIHMFDQNLFTNIDREIFGVG
jgi:hypothetical protein